MKKIGSSLLTGMLLTSSSLIADNISDIFEKGKISGEIRSFYIDRTYTGILENNRNSLAIGGNLGFETYSMYGVTLGVRFYTTNAINIHDEDKSSANYDPSLFGDNFKSYSMIGEAYLNYKISNTNVKIGRQKINTPLLAADDARMLPNLFEGVVVTNKDIPDTTIIASHITKESVGSFGNVYGALGSASAEQLALQSGYGIGYKRGTNGTFVDLGVVALGDGTDTDGVSSIAMIYNGIAGLKLQAWNYYAYDILNAIYLQGDYKFNISDGVSLSTSAQYINQSDIGDALAGEVDSQYMALKLGANIGNLSGYVAYSTTDFNNNAQANGGIITPWGGIPAFTQGMVTRHMFFADTETTKVALTYNIKEFGIKASAYYASFDIGVNNTYKNGTEWTAEESGFDIQYTPKSIKNLKLRLRANYPTDFAPGLDWSEYRIIATYKF